MCCSWIQRNEVEFSRGTKFSPGCLLSSFLPSSACSGIFVLLRTVLHAPQTHLRVPQLFTEWQRRKLCLDFCLFFFFCKPIMYLEALHVLLTEATPQTATVLTLVGPEKERLITVPWRSQRQAWPCSAYGQGWIRSSRCMESFFLFFYTLS